MSNRREDRREDEDLIETRGLSGDGGPEWADSLAPGSQLGRYILVCQLGAGGAGVVFGAFDPELDRRVAIKILRAGVRGTPSATEGQARLLREAQAMARLTHPNVMPVYDVGVVEAEAEDPRVFVAMELVEGGTLREWLKAAPRTRPQILAVYRAAGAGLHAAHTAGLVHRDFKPDNVLVARDGGRVLVTDFGLVHAGTDDVDEASLVGTPAYMAPEQHQRQPTTARTDQFSFCVALYEALYEERPFAGDRLEELAANVKAGTVRPPVAERRVPSWLRRLLLRGLSPRPEDRFPSMAVLLAELAGDPLARQRRWMALGGGAVVSLLLCGLGLHLSSKQERLCRGAEQHLAGVWDEAMRQQTGRVFAASGSSPQMWTTVQAALDDYGQRWAAMRVEACEATRLHGKQSEDVLALRMSCLDEQLRQLRALTEVLVRGDAQVVQHSVEAVNELGPLQSCADVAALQAPVRPPSDPQKRQRVDELRGRLAEARALMLAGRYKDGLRVAEATTETAHGLAYLPLEAEARTVRGELLSEDGQHQRAASELEEAHAAAVEGRHDAVAARAAIDLVRVRGYWLVQRDEGHRWARIAAASVDRHSANRNDNPELRTDLLRYESWIYKQEGDGAQAVARAEEALELGKRAFGEESLRTAQLYDALCAAHRVDRNAKTAMRECERAVAIIEKLAGPGHPMVIQPLNDLAQALSAGNDWDAREAAMAVLRRTVAVSEKALGPMHPRTGMQLGNLAVVLLNQSVTVDPRAAAKNAAYSDEGIAVAKRSIAINDAVFGEDYPDTVYPLIGLADGLANKGRLAEAQAVSERALRLCEGKGLDPALVASARFSLGQILWEVAIHDKGTPEGKRARARSIVMMREAGEMYAPGSTDRRDVEEWLRARGARDAE